MGKNNACTFMREWEVEMCREAEMKLGKRPSWWKRFVDEVFGVWKGSKEEFIQGLSSQFSGLQIEICHYNYYPRAILLL